MKARRLYLYLALFGLLLLALDGAQRWLYVRGAGSPAFFQRGSGQEPLTRVILVAGQGMDEAESATSRRDVAAAAQALKDRVRGRLEIHTVAPGAPSFTNDAVLKLISESDCQHLVVFQTGHGGGRNFGAVGGLNLTRDKVAKAVGEARFERATIVLDFCWSGEFGKSFAEISMPAPVTLITSTDAHHPCPFPVSFLSPHSFGRMFFNQWSDRPQADLVEVNKRRQALRRLYPESFGLLGESRTIQPSHLLKIQK